MSRRAFPLLLALVMLVGMPELSADRPRSVATLLETEENLTFLAAPERVEICLLTAKEPLFRRKSGKRRYVEGRPQPLPAAAADRLRQRLADDATYRWHTDSTGEPVWQARVKFFRGDNFLSVDFCFDSGLVLFARDGLPFSAEDYVDPTHEFFALIRARFPKEKALAAVASRLEAKARELAERNAAFERKSASGGP